MSIQLLGRENNSLVMVRASLWFSTLSSTALSRKIPHEGSQLIDVWLMFRNLKKFSAAARNRRGIFRFEQDWEDYRRCSSKWSCTTTASLLSFVFQLQESWSWCCSIHVRFAGAGCWCQEGWTRQDRWRWSELMLVAEGCRWLWRGRSRVLLAGFNPVSSVVGRVHSTSALKHTVTGT